MKNKYRILMLCLLLIALTAIGSFGDEQSDDDKAIVNPTIVTVDGKAYPVHLLWHDLNDPTIKVDLALAKNKIGTVEELLELSQSDDPDELISAAINASYFNMKPDSQPASTLLIDGAIQHIAEGGSVVGFDGDNQMHSEVVGIKIEGSVNNQWEYPYNWIAWNINHLFYQDDASMIFNNHYTGEFPEPPVYAVAVEQHNVVGKYDYIPEIPANGYIIVRRTPQFLDLFEMGDRVDYRIKTVEKDADGKLTNIPLRFDDIENAAGAGPILIKDGEIVLDPRAEGFNIAKFNSGAARRSMIGVTADNRMAMLVSDRAITLDELAKIALQLDLVEAFNLDGGGSSGLVYNGQYAVEPKRKVSNALVVKKLKSQPIRLVLNESEEYFDSYPFIYSEADGKPRTMVPLRGILEKIDADVSWNQTAGQVIVSRFGSDIVFTVGQKNITVDGKDYDMDVPLLIYKDRSYVSVRFLTEFFGGTVEWNAEKKLVDLTLPTVEGSYNTAEAMFAQGAYALALDQYGVVLNMFPRHVSALKRCAYIYDKVFDDQRTALNYYDKVLDVFAKDVDTYNKLATAYAALGVVDEAVKNYKQAIDIEDNRASHRALGDLYRALGEAGDARVHYQWLLDNAASVAEYKEAQRLLDSD